MSKFRVITDGSGDLSPELYKERDITMVPFYVMLGSGEYLKQDEDIGTEEFYEWMVSHPGADELGGEARDRDAARDDARAGAGRGTGDDAAPAGRQSVQELKFIQKK